MDNAFRTSGGRLRTPWRLLLAASLFMAVSLTVSVSLVVLGIVPASDAPSDGLFIVIVPYVVTGVALSVTAVLVAWYVDWRTLPDLGLAIDRRFWLDLVAGLALGFGLIAVPYLIGVLAGVYQPTVSPAAPDGYSVALGFVFVIAFTLVVGVYEELLFRGYLLTNAAEGLTAFVDGRTAVVGAIILSSLGFGAVHGLNPTMTRLGIGTISVAGALLGAGLVLTGRLALPIGVHISWNFAHFVFGLPVSGVSLGVRLLETERVGPAIVHGGAVGPEGGLLGFLGALVGCVVVVGYARWMGDAFTASTAELRQRE